MRLRNRFCGWAAVFLTTAAGVAPAQVPKPDPGPSAPTAESLTGVEFTPAQRELMAKDLADQLASFRAIRGRSIPWDLPPAVTFRAILPGMTFEKEQRPVVWGPPPTVRRPERLEDLAFFTVRELGELLKSKQISSVELTSLALDRLKRFGPELHCVVSLTEEIALGQAKRADEEIAAGNCRGPLHGVPYGLKDLFAVRGTRTTWGIKIHEERILDVDAAVYKRLEAAGAVLVAKLSLGELAWGSTWFGGMTRNPWNPEKGSGGSSAGPGSAVAAGLVPFAIGSETWGSIVNPAIVCRVAGLRTTFGRVSRAGAMPLSWTMDKVGPLARTAEDCALVFDAIRGPDGEDPTVEDLPFNYAPVADLSRIRIGVVDAEVAKASPLQRAALEALKGLGARTVPLRLPDVPVFPLSFIIHAEAAAVFDELTRSGQDATLARQTADAWPNVFRATRALPAVEYFQASRLRTLLMRETAKMLEAADVWFAPDDETSSLLTNLTGHPCVVLPCGTDDAGKAKGVCLIGRLYDEATLLAVAKAYQGATTFQQAHPEKFR